MKSGPRNHLLDVAGLKIGHAEAEHGRSGSTLILADQPVAAGVSVQGGAPGTRETELLKPDRLVSAVDGVVLSGGSAFGLAAADGAMRFLAEQGRGFGIAGFRVPILPAAIHFDLPYQGNIEELPDYASLGKKAAIGLGEDLRLGSIGAGAGATAPGLKSGIGSASLDLGEGIFVAALTVANPFGSPIADASGRFWAAPFEQGHEFGGMGMPQPKDAMKNAETKLPIQGGNTSLAVVATNAKLDKAGCTRLAVSAHAGLARAIVPSHTPFDGDLIFAMATGQQPQEIEDREWALLCHASAIVISRAVGRGIWHAKTKQPDRFPEWSMKYGNV